MEANHRSDECSLGSKVADTYHGTRQRSAVRGTLCGFEVSKECRALKPSLNLGWTCSLEEAFDRLLEIVQSLIP
jgi:hypothetical protein